MNSAQLIDEEHWSRNNKYDGDLFLESNYRKHLSRHANKLVFNHDFYYFFIINDCILCFRVLLRIRMLYYIKSDIVGEFSQQVNDGVNVRSVLTVI